MSNEELIKRAETESAQKRGEPMQGVCLCCAHYGRPGWIYNAGAWMHCPKCNPQYVK